MNTNPIAALIAGFVAGFCVSFVSCLLIGPSAIKMPGGAICTGVAMGAHRGQKRKYNNLPYIFHPMRVAGRTLLLANQVIAKEWIGPLVAAAWLHDVVEDCGVPIEEIRERFGVYVSGTVAHLTNVYTKETHRHLNREERKQKERERLRNIPPSAKLIKLIDRIDNLGEMSLAPDDFKIVYAYESERLANALLIVEEPFTTLHNELMVKTNALTQRV